MERKTDSQGNVWEKCPICHFWREVGETMSIKVFIQAPEGQQGKIVKCCGSCFAWFEAKNYLFDEGVPK